MKSIGFKVWMSLMFLISLMITLLWVFQIVFLEEFYLDEQISKINKKGEELIAKLEGRNGYFEDENILEELDKMAFTYHLNLEILDDKGNSIIFVNGNNDMQTPNMFKKSLTTAIDSIKNSEKIITEMEHPRFGITYVYIVLPFLNNGNQRGLVLTAPIPPVSETADILREQLIYISIILLISASLISVVISKQLTKPILKIEKAAEDIAKGKWDVNINTSSKDEIGQLAKAIKKMSLELKEKDTLRKELIGNISHELRTPLSLIKGYAETIVDISGEDREKRNKQLGIIIRETDRLSQLIKDIMNLSQLEGGTVKFNFVRIDLTELIQKIGKSFEDLSIKKSINFSVEIKGKIFVKGDATSIEQVLINLISNAFNHTKEGGNITIRIKEEALKVRIEVIDTGEGIKEEDIPNIWDRYYKGNKSDDYQGNGLGLAIVKKILLNHNSLYGVESIVNKGTTFYFELEKKE